MHVCIAVLSGVEWVRRGGEGESPEIETGPKGRACRRPCPISMHRRKADEPRQDPDLVLGGLTFSLAGCTGSMDEPGRGPSAGPHAAGRDRGLPSRRRRRLPPARHQPDDAVGEALVQHHGQEIVDTLASVNGPDIVVLLHDTVSYGVHGDHGGARESVQRVPMVFWSASFAPGDDRGQEFRTMYRPVR